MATLASVLELESRKRDLIASDEALTVESAFALVRDMPYQRASTRRPESIIEEWRGTCSGKHYLLDQIFREMGMDSRVIMCTHRFTRDNTEHFPPDLRALTSQEPVPDVHTYIRLESPAGWMTVDATWPSSSQPLGMPVNQAFKPGEDMTIACDPIETREVPVGRDPQAFKERLIAEFCGESSRVRDDFIEGMSRWLSEATQSQSTTTLRR